MTQDLAKIDLNYKYLVFCFKDDIRGQLDLAQAAETIFARTRHTGGEYTLQELKEVVDKAIELQSDQTPKELTK